MESACRSLHGKFTTSAFTACPKGPLKETDDITSATRSGGSKERLKHEISAPESTTDLKHTLSNPTISGTLSMLLSVVFSLNT